MATATARPRVTGSPSARSVLSPAPPPPSFIPQTQSINFNGTDEHMATTQQTSPPRLGIGGTFSCAVWFRPTAQPLVASFGVCSIGPVGVTAQTSFVGLFARNTGAGTNSIQFLLGDTANAFRQSVAWSGLFSGPSSTWRHMVITWGGTAAGRTAFFDGAALGAPDFTGINLDGTVDDAGDRALSIGEARFGVGSFNGAIASVAWWNGIQLGSADAASLFNSGDINFDLNTNSGGYVNAASLAHWNEIGKNPVPLLGANSAALAANPLDVDTASVNIDDSDRVVDVPP